jgi:hypothetical protein
MNKFNIGNKVSLNENYAFANTHDLHKCNLMIIKEVVIHSGEFKGYFVNENDD